MEEQVKQCEKVILEEARRDQLNGVGRVFISTLLERGFSREVVTSSIERLASKYRVSVVGNIVKVYFEERSEE
jgi:hypothetical protein